MARQCLKVGVFLETHVLSALPRGRSRPADRPLAGGRCPQRPVRTEVPGPLRNAAEGGGAQNSGKTSSKQSWEDASPSEVLWP